MVKSCRSGIGLFFLNFQKPYCRLEFICDGIFANICECSKSQKIRLQTIELYDDIVIIVVIFDRKNFSIKVS